MKDIMKARAHLTVTMTDLKEMLRKELRETEGLNVMQRLCQHVAKLERRIQALEASSQKRGPRPSNPIPER